MGVIRVFFNEEDPVCQKMRCGKEKAILHLSSTLHRVITGLVPVIPMHWSAAPHRIGMAGTDPRIKSGDGHDVEGMKRGYS
jgi:hypothetical protein